MKKCWMMTALLMSFLVFAGLQIARAEPSPIVAVEEPHAGFGERVAARLEHTGIRREWVIMLVSALPIVELRGAIPIGINLFK
ncbi:MAG: hypothetical protein V2A34_06160, partial [Lentisphaerota bacterium]